MDIKLFYYKLKMKLVPFKMKLGQFEYILRKSGIKIGEGRKTIIGDNVFIGMNSIILMGAHVGNNVVIGAGSVVGGNVPDNVGVAGNPAKVVCTLEEFYKKRKSQVLPSAVECMNAFYNHYGHYPSVAETGAFWPLFMKGMKSLCWKVG